jgi:hypothetical protein
LTVKAHRVVASELDDPGAAANADRRALDSRQQRFVVAAQDDVAGIAERQLVNRVAGKRIVIHSNQPGVERPAFGVAEFDMEYILAEFTDPGRNQRTGREIAWPQRNRNYRQQREQGDRDQQPEPDMRRNDSSFLFSPKKPCS